MKNSSLLSPKLHRVSFSFLALALLVLSFSSFFYKPQSVSALAPNFQDTVVFSGLTVPTAVRFAPNGKAFVAEKSGLLKVYDSITDSTPTVFADLRSKVMDFDDRGLLGLAVHPNFPVQPYVYVFYSVDANLAGTPYNDRCPNGSSNCPATSRLSRLTANGNVMSAEQVILEGWCEQSSHHSAGDLGFGADGALYVGHGDGGSADYTDYGQQANSCGDPLNEGGALHSQDLQTPGDPVTLAGSIIRINPDTGAALPDNPLIGGNTQDDRIIAYGLRNPFRFSVDRTTGNIWIGDAGWNTWEEVNRIISPTDGTVENFGWPCYEGVNRQPGYDSANLPICENLYTTNTAQAPYYQYATPGTQAITAVTLYRGANFPAEYRGALFFGDYTQGWIKVMKPGANGLPDPANVSNFIDTGATPGDLQVGPGGELFYVNLFAGTVRMVRYFTQNQNQPPVAVASADRTTGPAPLTVQFDGSASWDADPGDTLQFAWDLDGDGQFDDSTLAQPGYTYPSPGVFTVTLRVTDSNGAFATDSLSITSGNTTGPTVTILAPAASTTFRAGEVITFSGKADDPATGPLPPQALSWQVILHHCAVENPLDCHQHPQQQFQGVAGGTFIAPDHEYPAHLEFVLTAAGGTSQGTSWWNTAWTNRTKLTFNNSLQTEDLTDFPVLVKLDSSRIDYSKAKANGDDLRFIDAGNATILSYEIESWNPSGVSYIWVRVPKIDKQSSNDFIHMYYGNASAAAGQNRNGVWTKNFVGVWHSAQRSAKLRLHQPPRYQFELYRRGRKDRQRPGIQRVKPMGDCASCERSLVHCDSELLGVRLGKRSQPW